MGRDFDSPEQLRRFSVDSSTSSSTESSFRELDHVFLQTQTRIWLGEVLHTRLSEEVVIADLLADGKLLFQVSCVVGKMLLTKCKELRNSKSYMCEKAESEKRSWRYMPYSNVDSFLKICKVLGLKGIDLFSPSDVVEKKGSRRVCMCIRSLSKKVRLRGLNVPDFDVVTYTIAMPTDMVGGIRRSLEKAQYRILTSAGSDPGFDSKPKYCQKNWVADCVKQHDSYSEESDDAESNYNALGFDSPVSSVDFSLGRKSIFAENCILTQSTPVVEALGEMESESGACQSISILVMNGPHQEQHPESNYPPRAEIVRDYTSERDYLGFESSSAGFVSNEGGNTLPFNLQRDINSLCSNSIDRDSRYELIRSFSEEIENFEVSSTDSGNSISGTVGTVDYEDPFEAEDDSFNRHIPQHQIMDSGSMDACSVSDYEPLEMIDYEDVGSAGKPLTGAECGSDFGNTQNSTVLDEKSFSVPMSDIPGVIYTRNDQADLPGGDDGYFTQIRESGSLAAQDIDNSENSSWENGVMASPFGFPSCREGSDADPNDGDGTRTPNILYVDKLVVHHNHDVPLGSSALIPENDLYETPAASVRIDNNDQHLVDDKICLVDHKEATSQDKDVVYTRDTIDKEDIKNLKIEKHMKPPMSKQHKSMILKSVAGGVTLLGVFLLFQLRRKGKEKIKETLVPSVQINKPSSGEDSRQNKQHGNRLDRVYPGGKFKF
ncbi:hypothetical protein MKW94_020702 [Papaver nudicaule]|uniref:Calponin-homology (CH) domain-containing protein n=1 Tax=Papaver nudicaule TaxID=74823 RepID=A0AA41S8G2_PAPNU|nr:hypothetical protein [Papaver nudicaule]